MKKGFTLVEIILVIVLISLMMYSLRDFFKKNQSDTIYGDACSASVYGLVRNFVDNAATGRGFYSGSTTYVNPSKYYVFTDTGTNTITLAYSGSLGYGIYKTIKLNGTGNDTENSCYGTRYYVGLSGLNYTVSVNRQLAGDINNPAFQISGSTQNDITGASVLNFCTKDGNCKILGNLVFDKRTYNIDFNKCLQWTGGGALCYRWNK